MGLIPTGGPQIPPPEDHSMKGTHLQSPNLISKDHSAVEA